MATIISHFYNEEYILPWWLNHHKQIFDHGILIDYGSTDRSRDIIYQLCPDWEIHNSTNPLFDYIDLENQINNYQSNINGWRLTITMTEFLMGINANMLQDNIFPIAHEIPAFEFYDWNPSGWIPQYLPLWSKFKYGIPSLGRLLHNYYVEYHGGRHFDGKFPRKHGAIFKYRDCISSPEMVSRRLQIQRKIPEEHKKTEAGWQHHNYNNGLDIFVLRDHHLRMTQQHNNFQDLSTLINAMT
jgi:hypothetical protein